jgi:hypothetical protein
MNVNQPTRAAIDEVLVIMPSFASKRHRRLLTDRGPIRSSYRDQASSISPLFFITSVRSLVTHSRIYAEQFRSTVPLSSLWARNFTTSRSTRSTSSRSMATALASTSIALRSMSKSCFVIRPLTQRTRMPSRSTIRSIRQLILRSPRKLLLLCSFCALPTQPLTAMHRALSKPSALLKSLKLFD